MKKNYKERRLWYFQCTGCGHRAQSHRRFKAINGECQNCRRFAVPENQPRLFIDDGPVEVTDEQWNHAEHISSDRKGNTESNSRVS